MDSELQTQIESSMLKLNIKFKHINDNIIDEISKVYVKGEPRAWWLSLKYRLDSIFFQDNSAYQNILEQVYKLENNNFNAEADVYFIADEDNQRLFAYKIQLNKIPSIIESCTYFEYYIIAIDYSWLICENDHGELIICRYKTDLNQS